MKKNSLPFRKPSTYRFFCYYKFIYFLQAPATTINTPKSKAIIELEKYINELLLDRKLDLLMWCKEMRIYSH